MSLQRIEQIVDGKNITPMNVLERIFKKLAGKGSGSGDGGAGLPDVTSADNGMVLSVVDGAWAKADVPSGGGIKMYTYDATANAPATFSYNDIKADFDSGSLPVLLIEYSDAYIYGVASFISNMEGAYSAGFAVPYGPGEPMGLFWLMAETADAYMMEFNSGGGGGGGSDDEDEPLG